MRDGRRDRQTDAWERSVNLQRVRLLFQHHLCHPAARCTERWHTSPPANDCSAHYTLTHKHSLDVYISGYCIHICSGIHYLGEFQKTKHLSKTKHCLWWCAHCHLIQMLCAQQITDPTKYMRTRHYQSPAVARGPSLLCARGDTQLLWATAVTSLSQSQQSLIECVSAVHCEKEIIKQMMKTEEGGWRERRERRSCKRNISTIDDIWIFAVIMEDTHTHTL